MSEAITRAEMEDLLGRFATRIDARFDHVETRLDQVDARFGRIEAGLDQVDARLGRSRPGWTRSMPGRMLRTLASTKWSPPSAPALKRPRRHT
jgi:hypothetical protein